FSSSRRTSSLTSLSNRVIRMRQGRLLLRLGSGGRFARVSLRRLSISFRRFSLGFRRFSVRRRSSCLTLRTLSVSLGRLSRLPRGNSTICVLLNLITNKVRAIINSVINLSVRTIRRRLRTYLCLNSTTFRTSRSIRRALHRRNNRWRILKLRLHQRPQRYCSRTIRHNNVNRALRLNATTLQKYTHVARLHVRNRRLTISKEHRYRRGRNHTPSARRRPSHAWTPQRNLIPRARLTPCICNINRYINH